MEALESRSLALSLGKVGEVTIHYLRGGQGRPVVLLHGGGNDSREWKANLGPLSRQFAVYAPDLPGFGQSDKPKADYSLDFFVSFLGQSLDALGLERASLVGHSLGGGIALAFCLEYPQRVERLVLVDSLTLGREIHVPRLYRLAVLLTFARGLLRPSRAEVRRRLHQATYNEAHITEELVEQVYQGQKGRATREVQAVIGRRIAGLWGQRVLLKDRLPEVQCPTLILWGDRDRILPVSHARLAHRLIPNAQLRVFSRCGHAPQREKPAEFNQVVAEFLAAGASEAKAQPVLVAVVGGGRCTPQDAALAEAVGRELARRGAVVVCGGLGGVMEAACRGARAAGGLTIGILPGDKAEAANPFVQVSIPTGLGLARNTVIVHAVKAVIAVDGEFGTLSEIAFALQRGIPVVGLKTWSLSKDGQPDRSMIPAQDPAEAVAKALTAARREPL